MEEDLIKITPNKEKSLSIFRMVETTLEMVKQIDKSKFLRISEDKRSSLQVLKKYE